MILSLCTTCKGRLDFLKQTLPHNLKSLQQIPSSELILLDYNCYQDTANYISKALQHKQLKIYKETQSIYFNMSHAKNIAHKLASGSILVNVDADNFVSPEYLEAIIKAHKSNIKITRAIQFRTKFLFAGRISIDKQTFYSLNGYRESLINYGYDDTDLVERTHQNHRFALIYCNDKELPHTDELRYQNMPSKQPITITDAENKAICQLPNNQTTWGQANLVRIK